MKNHLNKNKKINNSMPDLPHYQDTCVWSYDLMNNKFIFLTKGFESVSGYPAIMFTKKQINWVDLIYEEDKIKYEKRQNELKSGKAEKINYRIIHKNGNLKWLQDRIAPSYDSNGKLIRLDGIVFDITEDKEKEERLAFLAYHDDLTGLPNRRLFEKELLEASNNPGTIIMYIDIDGFKKVNDNHGHLMGNKLLKEISLRLKQEMASSDLLARMGGDEFTVLIKNMSGPEYYIKLAKRILECFKAPFYINEIEFYITLSIGLSQCQDGCGNTNNLLEDADKALYKAKEEGKNNYHFYTSKIDTDFGKRHSIARGLRKAVKEQELLLNYQPKVCTQSGKIVGAEALIRWKHPEWGEITPGEFIPTAEENGIISEITDWSFRSACNQIKKWESMNLQIVPVSINISPKRFVKDDWVTAFIHIIRETKVNPRLLELEITESALIENQEKFISSIKRLKEMGIKISLDDFGTGYSSLLYLKKFEIDTVKIDQFFIKTYLTEGECPIAKYIISLAHELNMSVVAEGVESVKQLSFLQENGCDQIQGFLFSKPLPVEEFTKLLMKPILTPSNN